MPRGRVASSDGRSLTLPPGGKHPATFTRRSLPGIFEILMLRARVAAQSPRPKGTPLR